MIDSLDFQAPSLYSKQRLQPRRYTYQAGYWMLHITQPRNPCSVPHKLKGISSKLDLRPFAHLCSNRSEVLGTEGARSPCPILAPIPGESVPSGLHSLVNVLSSGCRDSPCDTQEGSECFDCLCSSENHSFHAAQKPFQVNPFRNVHTQKTDLHFRQGEGVS